MESAGAQVLVLGIGNLLWADEGFGVRAVERLHEQYVLPENVCLMDGGTQGLSLLPYVKAARKMIVFDAIDYGLEPGTLKVVLNDEVPLFLGAKKMSLHQTGFQEVLACSKLTGDYPAELVLIGVQPVELEDYGGSLRDAVKAQIQPAIEIALNYLNRWGVPAEPRRAPLDSEARLNPCSIGMETYETHRPGPEQACRTGDARFLGALLALGGD